MPTESNKNPFHRIDWIPHIPGGDLATQETGKKNLKALQGKIEEISQPLTITLGSKRNEVFANRIALPSLRKAAKWEWRGETSPFSHYSFKLVCTGRDLRLRNFQVVGIPQSLNAAIPQVNLSFSDQALTQAAFRWTRFRNGAYAHTDIAEQTESKSDPVQEFLATSGFVDTEGISQSVPVTKLLAKGSYLSDFIREFCLKYTNNVRPTGEIILNLTGRPSILIEQYDRILPLNTNRLITFHFQPGTNSFERNPRKDITIAAMTKEPEHPSIRTSLPTEEFLRLLHSMLEFIPTTHTLSLE